MTLVWFVVDMSSPRTYQTSVKVAYTGIDTARYVTTSADGELPVTVTTDGFSALYHHLYCRERPMNVDVGTLTRKGPKEGKKRLSIATDKYEAELQHRFSPVGSCEIEILKDSLNVTVEGRYGRAYKPLLKGVSFSFPDGYGLCGEATVSPDTIYLYGSEESLGKIESLHTNAANIAVGKNGGHFILKLDAEWQQFPDVRASQESVILNVPVEPYVEMTQQLKVHIVEADSLKQVKLYPDEVTVSFWVPQSAYGMATAEGSKAVVRMNTETSSKELPVAITDFPSNMRIKSVEPENVQYVIIK